VPYHERWEIETNFFELETTTLGGRVLRSRAPPGVEQETYALLVTYQALPIAISDAVLARPDLDPDRGNFTIALNTARDQFTAAVNGPALRRVDELVGEFGGMLRQRQGQYLDIWIAKAQATDVARCAGSPPACSRTTTPSGTE
jgi:hypothetical protein